MRTALYTTAAAVLMAAAAATPVTAQDAVRRYDIGGGPLDRALIAFGHQSGDQILYPSALVAGRTEPGRGAYTCRRLQCFERAVARRGFARALRRARPKIIRRRS